MMTAAEKRRLLVDVACSYLGCCEGDRSHRKIIDIYNGISPLPRGYKMSYADPWCASFVSAMGAAAGLGGIILPECACDAMIHLYAAVGRWKEDDGFVPEAGDIIMYDWQDSGGGDNRGAADHVGIVVSCDGKTIKVVEGNISDAVGYRTLAVNGRYIRGYCLPEFSRENAAGDGGEDGAKPCVVVLPELSRGDEGRAVKVMQTLLIMEGFFCGIEGADGEFGGKTEAGLKSFQSAFALKPDGICGRESWTALTGGENNGYI